jgi:hypothetical protein
LLLTGLPPTGLVAAAALGAAAGMTELAGPEPQDLVDMARRTLAAGGESLRLVPTWRGPFGVEMAGEVLLPGPGAVLTRTPFDQWLGQPLARRGRPRMMPTRSSEPQSVSPPS